MAGPPAMDRPVHPSAAQQTAIGGVDDHVDALSGDVPAHDVDPIHVHGPQNTPGRPSGVRGQSGAPGRVGMLAVVG